MGLNLDQLLLDHSHNFSATYTLANLVAKTNCRLEVLWMDWCPRPSTESLSWLLEIVSTDPVSPIVRVTFIDFREFLLLLIGVYLVPEMPPQYRCLSQHSLPILPTLDPFCFCPT